jgi:hypothetical protein
MKHETFKNLRRLTMLAKRKKTLMMKVFVVFVGVAMATAGFAAASSGRINPSGKVSIIKDGKVIGEFSQEVPLPEGALLRCEAKCAVKLDDVYMVAEPGTVFSVTPMADKHELLVQEGTVYYSATESTRPIEFSTPAGNATTRNLNVTDGELRGYVRVSGNETELGVIGGGSMMLETESGEMAITSGKQLTMTLTDPTKAVAATGGQEGLSTNEMYALGAVGAAIVAGGALALSSGGSSGSSGSPAGP